MYRMLHARSRTSAAETGAVGTPWPPQAGGFGGFSFEPTLAELAEARGADYGGMFRTKWRGDPAPRDNRSAAAAFGMRGAERMPEWGSGGEFSANVRRAVAKRITACLADTTQRSYATGERKFCAFNYLGCIDLAGFIADARAARAHGSRADVADLEREGEALVLGFISWCGRWRRHETGDAELSPGTVRNYAYGALAFLRDVAQLRLHKVGGIPDMLARLKKEYKAQRSAQPDRRLALVPELGRQIVLYANVEGTELALAFADVYQLTLFFGFRISELLLTSGYSVFDPDRHLTVGGVTLYQRLVGTKDLEEPVRYGKDLDDPDLPARLTAGRVRLGYKTKTMRARERRHTRVSVEGEVLCPVLALYRVWRRAWKGGRGPRDMAFWVAGRGELKAGAAPVRKRGPAPHLGGVALPQLYQPEPLLGDFDEEKERAALGASLGRGAKLEAALDDARKEHGQERATRERTNEWRLQPLVGALVAKRFDRDAAELARIPPGVMAREHRRFVDKDEEENHAPFEVDRICLGEGANKNKIMVAYHEVDGKGDSGKFGAYRTPYLELLGFADFDVPQPAAKAAAAGGKGAPTGGPATPRKHKARDDGKYGGVVTRIVHFPIDEDDATSRRVTGVFVEYEDGDFQRMTIEELEKVIENGEQRDGKKKCKKTWGTGYRGFLFTSLYLGPNGEGCFWKTERGKQRVDPRRYSSHSGRIALATVLFAADNNPFVAMGLADWQSWAVLDYVRDTADRFKGVADVIVQTKVTAPMAESYK